MVTDLSWSGCYIEPQTPLPTGHLLQLTLSILDCHFAVYAKVAISHPMVGMGMLFTSMSQESAVVLKKVLQQLANADQPQLSLPESLPSPEPGPAASSQPPSPKTIRLSGETAVAILGQIGRHLAEKGTLTQKEFFELLSRGRIS
jgi:hypothetical protein